MIEARIQSIGFYNYVEEFCFRGRKGKYTIEVRVPASQILEIAAVLAQFPEGKRGHAWWHWESGTPIPCKPYEECGFVSGLEKAGKP